MATNNDIPVSELIRSYREGARGAGERLFEYCYEGLVQYAQARMRGIQRLGDEPDDLAQSVLGSVVRKLSEKKLDRVQNRGDLWKVLFAETADKIVERLRKAHALKRGGDWSQVSMENTQIADACRSPEFAMQFQEDFERAMKLLSDADDTGALSRVAELRLEGCSRDDIRNELGVSISTVDRKLERIREIWRVEFTSHV